MFRTYHALLRAKLSSLKTACCSTGKNFNKGDHTWKYVCDGEMFSESALSKDDKSERESKPKIPPGMKDITPQWINKMPAKCTTHWITATGRMWVEYADVWSNLPEPNPKFMRDKLYAEGFFPLGKRIVCIEKDYVDPYRMAVPGAISLSWEHFAAGDSSCAAC